mmetsp:Transcript_33290/g.70403  ORF Transcript_33290/g.70403 Transcript_33290/m.70403 type:complete len:207 (-) Transcript_33290:416-1036(-)
MVGFFSQAKLFFLKRLNTMIKYGGSRRREYLFTSPFTVVCMVSPLNFSSITKSWHRGMKSRWSLKSGSGGGSKVRNMVASFFSRVGAESSFSNEVRTTTSPSKHRFRMDLPVFLSFRKVWSRVRSHAIKAAGSFCVVKNFFFVATEHAWRNSCGDTNPLKFLGLKIFLASSASVVTTLSGLRGLSYIIRKFRSGMHWIKVWTTTFR